MKTVKKRAMILIIKVLIPAKYCVTTLTNTSTALMRIK